MMRYMWNQASSLPKGRSYYHGSLRHRCHHHQLLLGDNRLATRQARRGLLRRPRRRLLRRRTRRGIRQEDVGGEGRAEMMDNLREVNPRRQARLVMWKPSTLAKLDRRHALQWQHQWQRSEPGKLRPRQLLPRQSLRQLSGLLNSRSRRRSLYLSLNLRPVSPLE